MVCFQELFQVKGLFTAVNLSSCVSLTRDSDYYQETVLHTALMGADGFLFWNPYCPKCGPGAVTPPEDNSLFSDILQELTEQIGCQNRQWVSTAVGGWNDPFVISGATMGSEKVYRFSPDVDSGPPESFIVATKPDLVFHVPYCNGTTAIVTFTSGQVIKVSHSVSTNGLWVRQPATGQMVTSHL